MKHCFTLCLLSLLTIAGCKKKDPEPPAFTGRWDWVQSTSSHYNSSGSFLGTDSPNTPAIAGAMYLAVSADSLNQHHIQTGILHQGYTRSGNVLYITSTPQSRRPPYTLKIIELADHKLVVRYEAYYYGQLSLQVDSEYSR